MKLSMHLPLTLALLASGFAGMAQTAKLKPPATKNSGNAPALTPAQKKAREKDPQKQKVGLALDMTEKQLKGFYMTLTTLIRGGKKDEKVMISLAAPGIMIEPELASKNVEDRKYISKMLDLANPKTKFFSMSPKKLSKSYGDIMNFGLPIFNTATPPKVPPALQADYDLTDPTIEDGPMKKYEAALQAYDAAVAARDSERVRNLLDPGRGSLYSAPSFATAVEKAERELNNEKIGNSKKIDAALERIRQFENNDPGIMWTQLVKEYNNGKFEDTVLVDTYPRMESWAKPEGWMKFHYKTTDKTDSEKYSKMDSDTTVTFKKGIVDATGKAKWEREETVKMVDDDSFVLDFELKRVFVNWPWLDWSVFDGASWKWNDVKKGTVIADGNGGGELPYVMRSFIMVRNVVISSNSIKNYKRNFMEKIKAEVDVTVGPFSVKSEFNSHQKDDLTRDNTKENSISIADPQILAFVSEAVPMNPAVVKKAQK